MTIAITPIARRAAVAAVAASAVAAVAVASASGAATPQAHQKMEYFRLGGVNTTQIALLHGAFTAGGKDVAHDQYDIAYLSGGTIRVDHPDKQSKFSVHVDPKTCFATFDITGAYTFGSGTGKYRGITGHGHYRGHGAAILPRTSSGGCSQTGTPADMVQSFVGWGPVTLK